jgi:hypothetical protein
VATQALIPWLGDATQIMPQPTFTENDPDPENYDESTIPPHGRREGRTWMF